MLFTLEQLTPQRQGECFVAHNATVIGDVLIGANVSIWYNVVIRADADRIVLGEDSNIQDAAVLHVDPGVPLTLGRGVTVGHKAMLHGCSVGDYSLIGINAVVLNGARIGSGCIIGANALVTENMEIPDGSLVVGSPARVRRSLGDDEREMLKLQARHYVANGRRHAEHLKALDHD
ncbi:MAG: gamma carbonic anhydrase family protein [Spongiibacteraceae bacterium]|jgi:carbonic anhydrase/acetyltransferase-like protein (isoleucine patch superfamily)|nr:gamma carbonic anhydrase family protein [Spongiibacteraceae bacterium]